MKIPMKEKLVYSQTGEKKELSKQYRIFHTFLVIFLSVMSLFLSGCQKFFLTKKPFKKKINSGLD